MCVQFQNQANGGTPIHSSYGVQSGGVVKSARTTPVLPPSPAGTARLHARSTHSCHDESFGWSIALWTSSHTPERPSSNRSGASRAGAAAS